MSFPRMKHLRTSRFCSTYSWPFELEAGDKSGVTALCFILIFIVILIEISTSPLWPQAETPAPNGLLLRSTLTDDWYGLHNTYATELSSMLARAGLRSQKTTLHDRSPKRPTYTCGSMTVHHLSGSLHNRRRKNFTLVNLDMARNRVQQNVRPVGI